MRTIKRTRQGCGSSWSSSDPSKLQTLNIKQFLLLYFLVLFWTRSLYIKLFSVRLCVCVCQPKICSGIGRAIIEPLWKPIRGTIGRATRGQKTTSKRKTTSKMKTTLKMKMISKMKTTSNMKMISKMMTTLNKTNQSKYKNLNLSNQTKPSKPY